MTAVAWRFQITATFSSVNRTTRLSAWGCVSTWAKRSCPEYFSRAYELLRPGGVFLNHGIAYSSTYRRQGPSFSDRYVFPDADSVPINATIRAAELSGFEVGI